MAVRHLFLLLTCIWLSISLIDGVFGYDEVLTTREYHQLTSHQVPGRVGFAPMINGNTVYFPRKSDDDSKWEIMAVDAKTNQSQVVDTWVIAQNGALHGFSYSNGPVMIGSTVVRHNGRNVVELTQPVVNSVSGPLFSVGFGANIRDSTMQLDTGVYRVTGGSYEVVLSAEKVAGVLGVLPREVARMESLSSSRDGSRFACICFVGSERPEVAAKNGHWFITYDGGNITVMNEDNKPYPIGSAPFFSVSGGGGLVAWGDYNWLSIRLTSIGEKGGREIFSGKDRRGIQLGSTMRFFYAGDKLAVLMGDSGYAVLTEGGHPFEVVPPDAGVFASQGGFQNVYVSESTSGLFAANIAPLGVHQVGVMRLNPPRELQRSDAPVIRQYTVNPPFISNDISRASTQRVAVQSTHPIIAAVYMHLKDGLSAWDDTAYTAMVNNGQAPDEVADDNVWSGRLWVNPQITGSRTVRTTVISRDANNVHHGFGIEIGPYTIADNPPPSRPDLIDVESPAQSNEDENGVNSRDSITSTNTGAGNNTAGSNTGGSNSTGGSNNTGAGNSGTGGNTPANSTGSGTNTGTGRNTGAGSNTGAGRNTGSGPGGAANTGGTPPKPLRPIIAVSRRDVQPGETVTIPVYIRNPQGTANLNVEVSYDPSVIVPVGETVRGNSLPSATLFSANSSEEGIVRIGFAGSSMLVGDGTIAEVTFRAVGGVGSSTELPPRATTMNTASREDLTPTIETGAVRIVARRTPGDFDGDGRSTAADALAALEMSVRLRPVDLVVDMDSDGTVTSLDAALILRAAVGGAR